MDPAFLLVEALPSPGALAFAAGYFSAWPASDGPVATVMQRIIRNMVGLDVVPHRFPTPVGHGVQLQNMMAPQLVEFIQLQDPGLRAGVPLISSQACDPDVDVGEFLLKRQHFAQGAAGIGICFPNFVKEAVMSDGCNC